MSSFLMTKKATFYLKLEIDDFGAERFLVEVCKIEFFELDLCSADICWYFQVVMALTTVVLKNQSHMPGTAVI